MISLSSYPIGVTALILVFLGGLLVFMNLLATVLTHTKIIRLSLTEAILIAQFEGAFMLLIGLIIGQQFVLAFFVFLVFAALSILLFVKRANRWWLERQDRKAMGSTMQKEFKDRRQ